MSKFKYVKHSLTAVACAMLIAVNGMPMNINAETTTAKQETSGTSSKHIKESQNKVIPSIAKIEASGQSTNLALDGDLGDEDSRSILGGSWYYGIVADEFDFNGESETNFAVKTFKHQNNGEGGQTGITDKGKGSEIAYFVAGSIDAPFLIKGIEPDVTTTAPAVEPEKRFTVPSGKVPSHRYLSKATIDSYITSLRNDAQIESERLAKLDSVKSYDGLPDNQMFIDVTSAGNKTVYLNADAWKGLSDQLKLSSGIKIIKNKGQKVVINYPNSTEVKIQKVDIYQVDEHHQKKFYDMDELANHPANSEGSAGIPSDIIFNMPNATDVTLLSVTGIFLAPQATVKTASGANGGWINCKTLINGIEWHSINGELTKEDKPSIFENPKTPTETPKTPSVTPKTPTETPKTPSVTPKTPTETPKIPSVTPKTPTETPKAPTETPKTPTETPKTPSVTPKTPTETPKIPSVTPKTPTETPKTPTETPKAPSVTPKTPKTPTETPKTPAETPKTPTETPKTPAETPKAPTETPKAPTETPKNTNSTTSSTDSTDSTSSSTSSTDSTSSSSFSTSSNESTDSVASSTDSTNSTTSGRKSVVVTQNNQNTGNTSGGQTTYATTPSSSNEVTQTSEGSTTTRSPQTGDTNRVGVYGTTLVAALFVLCLVLRKRSSKNK